MKRCFILIVLWLFLCNCNPNKVYQKIDSEVNQAILGNINAKNQDLWKSIESEFYNRLIELGYLNKHQTDTIKAISQMDYNIAIAGYPSSFFIDQDDPKNQMIIEQLNEIGLTMQDECAQNYIYKICKPIITKYEKTHPLDSTYLMKRLTSFNPKSIGCSFLLMQNSISELNLVSQYWSQPGARKVLILIYLSGMLRLEAPQEDI